MPEPKSEPSRLSLFRQAVEDPKHDKKNPHFKSSYASLSSVLKAIRPALDAAGLDLVQTIELRDEHAVLVTRLCDNSPTAAANCWATVEYPIDLDGDPQKAGSRLTYARRYSLTTICGIVGEEDDDGNAASGANAEPSRRQRTKPSQPRPSQAEQHQARRSGSQVFWAAIWSECSKHLNGKPTDEQRKAVMELARSVMSEHGATSTNDLSDAEQKQIKGEIIEQLPPVLFGPGAGGELSDDPVPLKDGGVMEPKEEDFQ